MLIEQMKKCLEWLSSNPETEENKILQEHLIKSIDDHNKKKEEFKTAMKGYHDMMEVMRCGDLEYTIMKQEGPRGYSVPALQCRRCKSLFEKKLMKCDRCGEKFEYKSKFYTERYDKK